MSVLLTGGAGFIGSHIAVELINAELDPIIADDFSNSSPDVIDRLYAITSKRIPCYEINVADAPSVSRIFEGNAIDAVIHCAGFKAVGESVSEPVRYYRNNLDTTLTILEQMKAHGCENIVFSSSATVYGGSHTAPFTEDMSTGDCTNPYGKTKYFIEEILKDTAFADKSLSVVLLRYFNPIGAHESGLIGEKPNGIPNNLMPYITQTAAAYARSLVCSATIIPRRTALACAIIYTLWTLRAGMWLRLNTQRITRARKYSTLARARAQACWSLFMRLSRPTA